MQYKIQIPRPHSGQKSIVSESARFNVVNCGRRFGKTIMGEDRLVHPALKGYPVAWFAPSYKLQLEPWRDLVNILKPVTTRKNATERRIELMTGGVVEFWSLDDKDAARGRKYARIVIDEAAMVKDLGEAWNAALRPTLADYQGDAWLLSTPKGHNFFKRAYDWGQDPLREEWRSWTRPTSDNPFIKPEEVEAMATTMPERLYKQEILAEFIEDGGLVFRRVREAATATKRDKPRSGHSYVFGVDWGKLQDFTVITVIDETTKEEVFKDRFNQIDYTIQLTRLKALAKRFNPRKIIAEKNSMGEPLVEQLFRSGLPVEAFQTTNDSKQAAIDALALGFEKGEIKILPDEVAISELQAYEIERLPSGRFRYNAPEGMHDDCVMSMALAWQEVSKPQTWWVT